MKKNGFTLIEILVVLVIISVLLVITIPNVLKVANSTKETAYNTKISLMQEAAITYGQLNKSAIMKGINPSDNSSNNYVCVENNGKVGNYSQKSYSATESLDSNTYRCARITVKDLVESGNLNYDTTNVCSTSNCTEANKEDYDNIVTNPTNNYIINSCYIYVYYKYNRVYAYFDKDTCNNSQNTNQNNGTEYRQLS